MKFKLIFFTIALITLINIFSAELCSCCKNNEAQQKLFKKVKEQLNTGEKAIEKAFAAIETFQELKKAAKTALFNSKELNNITCAEAVKGLQTRRQALKEKFNKINNPLLKNDTPVRRSPRLTPYTIPSSSSNAPNSNVPKDPRTRSSIHKK